MIERNPAVPVINLMTHNHYDYRDERAGATQRLRVVFSELEEACDSAGVRAVGATLADVADAVLAAPPVKEAFVSEGTVFEMTVNAAPEIRKIMNNVVYCLSTVALVCATAHAFAQADKYPTKPVRMMLPFTAGTQTDVLARLIGQKLTESLWQADRS